MIIDEKVIMTLPPPYPDSSYTYPRTGISDWPLLESQPQSLLPAGFQLPCLSPPHSQSQSHSQSYPQSQSTPSSAASRSTLTLPLPSRVNLATLPAHIHLQIIHHTFPYSKPQLPTYSAPIPAPDDDGYLYTSSPAASSSASYNPNSNYHNSYGYGYNGYATQDTLAERQRRTLLWLSTSLRLVNRSLYIACMHVLRSTYLPAYLAMVKAPYTSDPFPMGVSLSSSNSTSSGGAGLPAYPSPSSPSSSSPRSPSHQSHPAYHHQHQHSQHQNQHTSNSTSPLKTPHREPPILDKFIALKIRSDVLLDESSLHLSREDAFRDLFDVEQPRARLEDLVREVGVRSGVVWVAPSNGLAEGYNDGMGGEYGYGGGYGKGGEYGSEEGHGQARIKPLGMSNPSGSSSSSSLQILREVDAQIEARRAYLAARAQIQAQYEAQVQAQMQRQSKNESKGKGKGKGQDTGNGNGNGKGKSKMSFFSFRRSQPAPPSSTWHSRPSSPTSPTQRAVSPTTHRSSSPQLTHTERASSPTTHRSSSPSSGQPTHTERSTSPTTHRSSSPFSQTQPTPQSTEPPPPPLRPIPFHFLSVSFAPRKVGLVLARTRTIAEVPRQSGYGMGGNGVGRETLEVLAGRIVDVLGREMGGR